MVQALRGLANPTPDRCNGQFATINFVCDSAHAIAGSRSFLGKNKTLKHPEVVMNEQGKGALFVWRVRDLAESPFQSSTNQPRCANRLDTEDGSDDGSVMDTRIFRNGVNYPPVKNFR